MNYVPLGEFLKESNVKVDINDSLEYKCGGIKVYGRGIYTREIKLGADIQKKWVMHKVEENNVLYSTLFANNGAFAIAKKEDEELIFSEKFVCFKIIDENVLPEYLHVIFQTNYLSSQCDEFKTGMAAMSLSHSSKKKVLKLAIPIPDKNTQLEIINKFKKYEQCKLQLENKTDLLLFEIDRLKNQFVKEQVLPLHSTSLSKLGNYIVRSTKVEAGKMYKQITVKLHGNGVVLRKLEDGGNIKSSQYLAKTGDLIYSKIDVKTGAIGFIPSELNDGVVTADFPLVEMKNLTDVDKEFLMIYFSSSIFSEKLLNFSNGTTNRVRTKKSAFLETEVPWGTEEERKSIVKKYKQLCFDLTSLNSNNEKIQNEIPLLTSKYLNKLLKID